ncbi:MAG: GDP-fucose synthetase [Candidatus Nephthysia bennettiae]|uniref:GDP-L-fucose synthase n=1 Tax=Candidatus Nephthysia bennettiae TaxID=3127016 RepID=A0A934NB98_9BACT|nr:GDP-L-fucose synthase [Candidatus Dormibacteraeota bacterium]MBJ7612383.1 GDP-L-fucose synthase [Candidatus Dormibacteraeota bacterium]PZR88439.1 MAG: GDP-fucose synthetase [Candidatus Dormibacteraeota bacterium]
MGNWWEGRRVTVTGGRGFVGRRVVAMLEELRPAAVSTFSSFDYDLTRQDDVSRMYEDTRPDVVIHLAARVGGIGANRQNPGRFFYENMVMGVEVMEQARRTGVEKFVQVGTVCAYPKYAPVPFSEDSLWDGYPEETNAPYGIAKKALLVQAQSYRAEYGFNAIYLLPANLYGPGDNFDEASSHVIPALIRKCTEARDQGLSAITAWGTGTATREFLYVDDAAQAILLAAERYDKPEPVNLGTSHEVSIRELTEMVVRLTGYQGRVDWDPSKPDGQPRRKLDVQRARDEFGFEARVALEEGLRRTIDWYQAAGSTARAESERR